MITCCGSNCGLNCFMFVRYFNRGSILTPATHKRLRTGLSTKYVPQPAWGTVHQAWRGVRSVQSKVGRWSGCQEPCTNPVVHEYLRDSLCQSQRCHVHFLYLVWDDPEMRMAW